MKLIKLCLLVSIGCRAFEGTTERRNLLEKKAQALESSKKEYEERLQKARLNVTRQTKAATEDIVTPEIDKRKKLIDATRTELFEQMALESVNAELRSTQDELSTLTKQVAQLLEKPAQRSKSTAQDFFSTVRAYFKNLAIQPKAFFRSPITHDALNDYYTALANVVKAELAQSGANASISQTERDERRQKALKNPLSDPSYTHDLRILQAAEQRVTASFNKQLAAALEKPQELLTSFRDTTITQATKEQIPDLVAMMKGAQSAQNMNALFGDVKRATSQDALFTMLSGEVNPYTVLGLQPGALTAAQIEKSYQEKSKTVPQAALKTARDRLLYTKPLVDSLLNFGQQLAKQANTQLTQAESNYRSSLTSAVETIQKRAQKDR